MKKLNKRFHFAMILAVTMLLSLAACGKNAETSDAKTEGISKPKIVVLPTDALGAGGVPDDMNYYMKKALEDFDIDASIYEATDDAQYEDLLRSYCRAGADLIITTFSEMVEAVSTVASEYPDVKFSIMLPLTTIDLPNVRNCEFACWELYYLAGIAAGYMTDSNIVGHVLGTESSALFANNNAYRKGLKTVNPDAVIEVVNANTFADPAVGKDVGTALCLKGCDVILTDCSNTSSGVIEAAKESDCYVFGDAGKHWEECPEFVLGDTQCNYGPATYKQIKEFVEGTWEGGVSYGSLASGSISLDISPEIEEHLDTEMLERWYKALAAVEAVKEKIVSGELVIEMDTEKRY